MEQDASVTSKESSSPEGHCKPQHTVWSFPSEPWGTQPETGPPWAQVPPALQAELLSSLGAVTCSEAAVDLWHSSVPHLLRQLD